MKRIRSARFGAALLVLLTATACARDPEVAKREYLASGDRYAAEGKYSEAAVEYRNAIQQDPLFGEARFKLGGVYLRLDDARSAYGEYVRAADLLPNDIEAQVKAIEMLLLAGQFENAKGRAEKALALDSKHVAAQILYGNALAGLKKFDAALKEMEQALTLDPDRSITYANIGTLELARGNQAQAEAAFQKAVELEPTSIFGRLSLANFYWALGRSRETEQTLKEAGALKPDDPLANRALAVFFLASNRAPEAEPYLQALVRVARTGASKLWLADYYWTLARRVEAEKLLLELATDKETASQAKLRLAGMAVNDNKLDAAKSLLDEIVRENPKNIDGLLARASLMLREGRPNDALVQAQEAVKIDSQSPSAHLMIGRARAAQQEWDRAIDAFTQVMTLAPRALTARLELARAHLGRSEPARAVQVAQEAVSLQPRSAEARLMLVRALIANGDSGTTETHMKLLVEAFPTAPGVQAQLGAMHALKKNAPAARRAFEQALATDPKQLEALAGLVSLELQAKQTASAVARIESALGAAPNDTRLLMLAAHAYAAAGNGPEAERVLRRSVEIDPSNLQAYRALGGLYASQGRLDAARAEFERVTAARPQDVSAHTLVAMIHQTQGKTAEARARYQQALDHDPHAAVAANNLAWLLAETGENLDVALQLAQTAKARLPDSPEVNDTLGLIYVKKGLPSLAIAPLQQSVSADHDNADYHYHLGLAYAKLGQGANARRLLDQALKLQPGGAQGEQIRSALAQVGQ